jgi:hypothetical protein
VTVIGTRSAIFTSTMPIVSVYGSFPVEDTEPWTFKRSASPSYRVKAPRAGIWQAGGNPDKRGQTKRYTSCFVPVGWETPCPRHRQAAQWEKITGITFRRFTGPPHVPLHCSGGRRPPPVDRRSTLQPGVVAASLPRHAAASLSRHMAACRYHRDEFRHRDVELIVGSVVKLEVLPLGRRANSPHGQDGLNSTYKKSLQEIAAQSWAHFVLLCGS